MQLKCFRHHHEFQFALTFIDGKHVVLDLAPLIGKHVPLNALNSARIDPEWGCLEFCDGAVDIDPSTLYAYSESKSVE